MELELTDENGGNLTKTAGDAVSMMSPVNNFKTFLCSHLHRSRNKRESSSSSSIPPCPSSFFFCRLKATLVTSYVDIFFTDLTFGHSSSIFGEQGSSVSPIWFYDFPKRFGTFFERFANRFQARIGTSPMVLTTIFSVKRTQKYTAHLQRSVISTMLRTIPSMKRYSFLSFASMMFIIISIKSTIAFVTMRIFAQDPPSDAQPWSWCPSTCTGSIFSRTLENNHLRFNDTTWIWYLWRNAF